jgi:rubrerythrin
MGTPRRSFRVTDIRTGLLVTEGIIRAVSPDAAARFVAKSILKKETLVVFMRADEVDMHGVPIESACDKCGYTDVHDRSDELGCPSCA